MKNVYVAGGVFLVVALLMGVYVYVWTAGAPTDESPEGGDQPTTPADHKNISYRIEGEDVRLVDGYAETNVAPDSASRKITRYFGNEVMTDLNADGQEDVVFLLTQEGGGSGTFFYVVAALKNPDGYRGSEALLLGDRIAPQTTEVTNSGVVVNYADRKEGDSFTDAPTEAKSLYLRLDTNTMQFGEVAQNFEGEASPTLMALDMKEWKWVEAEFADGRVLTPTKPDVFNLTFGAGGGVAIGTDCNSMSSSYEAYSGALTFGPISSTKMYCEGSQEAEFAQLLDSFATYQFTGKGELIVKTTDDTKVIFR